MPTDAEFQTVARFQASTVSAAAPERRMRMLVINWQDRMNPAAGGAEVHLHETLGRLVARGHEVVLLVSGWKGAAPRARIDGMEVHRVGSRYTFPVLARGYYRRHLRALGFDLVVEDLNKLPLGTPRWVDSPVLLLVHHLFGATAFSSAPVPVAAAAWVGERMLARVYGGVPVQAVSESTAEDLVARGFRRAQVEVVHNGIDLDFYHPGASASRSAEPSLVFVGRLTRYKRVDLVIRALAFMKKRGLRPRFWVVGSGSERAGLQRLAQRLGVADQVEFTGAVSQERKRELLRSAWVHVLTSEKEGWGLTVMEAAACGTATIGSASPGLVDSVVHRKTGRLLPHGDWVDLGRQLADLIGDRATLEEMGKEARRRALWFSWERTASRVEQHMLRVIGAAGSLPEVEAVAGAAPAPDPDVPSATPAGELRLSA